MNRRKRAQMKARRIERARVEQARREKLRAAAEAFQARVAEGERRGCLFCRESNGGFTTEEHTLPESLGNTEVVLPNGVVCDRCNNGVLSDLDQALGDFMPLRFRRTTIGVPTKAGKVPVTRFAKGTVANQGIDPKTGEPRLFFSINNKSDTTTFRTTPLGGGRVHINFSLTGGRRMTPRYASELSRALLKTSFECAWLDHGEAMLEPEYDHVRKVVLGEPRDGYLLMPRRADPDHYGLELTYIPVRPESSRPFLAVGAQLYGIGMFTDSAQPAPQMEVPEDVAVVFTFTKQDTRRRKSRPA
jgi:HNH endonuclease